MGSFVTGCARSLLIVALGMHAGACGDDDDSNDKSDKDKSGGETTSGGATDAPGGANAEDPRNRGGEGAAETGPLNQSTCLAAARRAAQASEECLGCICETVAACNRGCQELLLCVFANCADVITDGVAVAACALRSCSMQAFAPGATEGVAEAIGTLASCGPVCQPPMVPGEGPLEPEPDPGAVDAGAESDSGAGQ